MLLLVDIGNTHTLFAIWNNDGIDARWRISTNANRTEDEYAVWLLQLMQHEDLNLNNVEAVIVGSVVPQVDYCIGHFAEKYFSLSPIFVGADGVDLGVKVRLPNPKEAGADRLVNALAAWKQCAGAAVVVDFGTATTFDVIDGEGCYVGGVIAPGVHLSLQALHVAAAKLPNIAVEKPEKIIGTSTEEAMQSGIYYGYTGLIDGILERLKEDCETSFKTIATGGLAPLFFEAVSHVDILEPDLTLLGLKYVYELNNDT